MSFNAAFQDSANQVSSGEKAKARDIVAALRILKSLQEPSPQERDQLRRFAGFGPVANSIFLDPATGLFKDGWREIGAELRELLTPEEYSSAKRTTFNAFYTSPAVMGAVFAALARFGLPATARVLEPGCGIGNFIGAAPPRMRFTGVEMDTVSGGIARLLYPDHDIRIENFRDSKLPEVDAVVGNVPFADISLTYGPHSFSLHDFFFAKSVDALAPGGVLGLVTSRYTLDKADSTARQYLADAADFLGAFRLPDTAFKDQGTRVVADIVFLRKRHAGEEPRHAGAWIGLDRIGAPTGTATINEWFVQHPDMILGGVTLENGRYGRETFNVTCEPDEYPALLSGAIQRLPEGVYSVQPATHRPKAVGLPVPGGMQEGAFLVAADGAILQLECGELLAVCHVQTALRADGGLMGRRLAALIGLRDDARSVLRAQNEGRTEREREDSRRALNRAYDRFTKQFGPINKTTFGKTSAGVEIRRMPNLVKFREDPDAFLVMSIEEYDDSTGDAEKAPIMLRDVVGPAKGVDSVATAEEGLLVSLNELGVIDIDRIAALYGREPQEVVAELGDLIFNDPETGLYETKDAYLSGNVRRKLVAAAAQTDPKYQRNLQALQAVQPEDILPGDIDANLGAPWLPVKYLAQFAAELFGGKPGSVQVAHMPKDAIWSVDADREVVTAVPNMSDYGTARISGLALFEKALNLQSPQIFDKLDDKLVLNQTETLAAKDKQKRIKQQFSNWVFAEHDRAEHLVRIYNDTFNNIRLRQFDGSHLTFPGMAQTFNPRQHQRNVVWRIISSGNTLMAHAVGAGKTGAMAMAAMKLRQTGLVRKSVIVVPNHMLEQFGREFLQIYPNARLLIAGKDDMQKDRRRLLTAKIATGEWDAIIVTHSSFERIGMSTSYQERFLQAQIDDYDALLVGAKTDGAERMLIKQIEKRKAAYAEKIKELTAERKKDDGLVFDELGVDQIFLDESHYFKNLETPTKMDRVAGIQTAGSQRAFDLYMKCRFLDERHEGRGVAFATGTPISNTMVEMYTLKRYLARGMLEERGIEHFDAWAASFGQVVENMEISPDGASLRSRARFAQFVNLPELQQMFRSFADVQTADMLKLPVPVLKGGKACIVSCEMSESQVEIQTGLIARYEKVRGGGVDPREDNALKITTDGRKLALDARLVDGLADGFPLSKIEAMLDKVAEVWAATGAFRGTQMIFSDIGVNPTEWGFCVYDDIKRGLILRGIPPEQIADIGDANSDAKKETLFEKVRAGIVRVILGSTAKMGTGTNVQKRLYAMHHIDAPWKPAEIEQRDGRILRQGNTCAEVEIYRYVTEGSFDAYMWQTLENKARFISQIMKGEVGVRRAADIGGQELSFAEVKAIASGNPAVLTLAEMDADIQRMSMLKRSHSDEQYRVRAALRDLPAEIARLERRAAALAEDHATAEAGPEGVTVGERFYADREKGIEAMNLILKPILSSAKPEERRYPVGSYRGLALSVDVVIGASPELQFAGKTSDYIAFKGVAAGALLNRIDRLIEEMPWKAKNATENANTKASQLEAFKSRFGIQFEDEARLTRLWELRNKLEGFLAAPEDQREGMAPVVAEYQASKAEVSTRPPPQQVQEVQEQPVEAPPVPVEIVQGPEPLVLNNLPAIEPSSTPLPDPGALTAAWQEMMKPAQSKPAPAKRSARRSAPDQMTFCF